MNLDRILSAIQSSGLHPIIERKRGPRIKRSAVERGIVPVYYNKGAWRATVAPQFRDSVLREFDRTGVKFINTPGQATFTFGGVA